MSLSLVTASYHRDFEACRLLCDSIDAYVTGYERHYIVVAPEDLVQFRELAGLRREIVDASALLSSHIWSLPMRWRGRKYSWAPGLGLPIYGWHLQQLRKIAMTLAQPSARVLHIDSDNCFVRPFDVSVFADGAIPLQVEKGIVNSELPDHMLWWQNAHRVIGVEPPEGPGDDHVGQMIVWEKASMVRIAARIEAVSQRPWWQALGRMRQFSEYMVYGVAVLNDPELAARHRSVSQSPCLAYWDGPALNEGTLRQFAGALRAHQSAIAVQSFTGTPIALIRRFALDDTRERAA